MFAGFSGNSMHNIFPLLKNVKKSKGFDADKSLNAVSSSPLEGTILGEKKCPDACKSGCRWVRD